MAVVPMFPLGAVLFPYLPLRLRVFEPRYLTMLAELLRAEDQQAAFGVVLIERGHEVGGGEHRFRIGTMAEITELAAEQGMVGLVAQGRRRFEVTGWLPEDPYPRAEVRELPDLTWDPALEPRLREVEQTVRRTLAQASEFAEVWPADVALDEDPVAAAWQLAGIAPVNPLDQLSLLRAGSIAELLELTATLTSDAALTITAPWPDQGPGSG